MRSATHAASQLPGEEPTDVYDAPAPALYLNADDDADDMGSHLKHLTGNLSI